MITRYNNHENKQNIYILRTLSVREISVIIIIIIIIKFTDLI